MAQFKLVVIAKKKGYENQKEEPIKIDYSFQNDSALKKKVLELDKIANDLTQKWADDGTPECFAFIEIQLVDDSTNQNVALLRKLEVFVENTCENGF